MSDFEKLINASDLIEWIMETYPDWCVGAVRSIVDHVESMRSAQPERKKGKWILTEDDNYEDCTCSECGYQNGENWMIGSDIPFCAMCGAEMRKGEEE